jgi:hypothetical protein
MFSITLRWVVFDNEEIALVFDKDAFSAFEALASSRGMKATEMIGETVAGLFDIISATPMQSPPYN